MARSFFYLAAICLSATGVLGGPVELEKRQRCGTCPLGSNPLLTLVKHFIQGDGQSDENCRWESNFGLHEDLGGRPYDERKLSNMLRVNYNEFTNQCAVEALTESLSDGKSYCVMGDCGIAASDDRTATVRWGVCMLMDTADPAQAMGALVENQNCVPTSGEVVFTKRHKSEDCDGSDMISARLGNKDIREMAPREKDDGSGWFWGGNVMQCSGLK
ncbi:hypothetical protein GTA08_BOTSDO03884 [Botryosphaeria dothidea]|uniref:Secreted protein n=1 Tax=Botryosphaeria dothidea TaxID=55169 RepID=A0A8H4N5Z9_9PEZI|nr:hypothetical protein GTA08_BOTSDO03884 [Botryosphaeria dothidea]